MRDADGGEITRLLDAWSHGDGQALERLVPLVYPELKRLARRQLARGRPGETLNTTGLVHEAYLKLVDQTRVHDRQHFFRLAAQVMRPAERRWKLSPFRRKGPSGPLSRESASFRAGEGVCCRMSFLVKGRRSDGDFTLGGQRGDATGPSSFLSSCGHPRSEENRPS